MPIDMPPATKTKPSEGSDAAASSARQSAKFVLYHVCAGTMQAVTVVAPTTVPFVPEGHGEHDDFPSSGLYDPAAHSVHSD